MFEQYKHLPGHQVTLIDGGLHIQEPTPATAAMERVLILGTATDGPVGVPVRIRRANDVASTFGTYVDETGAYNGATLAMGYSEAYAGGARNIYLMRITGKPAEYTLTDEDDKPQLIVRSAMAGDRYNQMAVAVVGTTLQIWSVADSGNSQPTMAYNLDDYATYRQLMNAFNEDQEVHGAVLVLAENIREDDAVKLAAIMKTNLAGGDDELDLPLGSYDQPGTYRHALGVAYEAIKEGNFSVIVPRGVHVRVPEVGSGFGSPDYTDAEKLGELLLHMNKQEYPAVGVIGVSRLNDPTPAKVKAFADALVNNPPSIIVEGEDAGRYISIVVAEPTFFDANLGVYANDGAAIYGGLVSSLPSHHSTTNTAVPGSLGLRWFFTLSDLDRLTGAGFVTMRHRRNRGIVVTADPTAAARNSDYMYLSTVRIVNEVVGVIRQIASPYIGRPVSGEKRNSLETDIQTALESMQRQGKLLDANFTIDSTIYGFVRGELDIELDLVPPFILRRLNVRISLRPTS